jgi:hypothetical protein
MLIMQIVEVVKTSIRDADSLMAIQGGINKILRMHNAEQEVEVQDAVIVEETDGQITSA